MPQLHQPFDRLASLNLVYQFEVGMVGALANHPPLLHGGPSARPPPHALDARKWGGGGEGGAFEGASFWGAVKHQKQITRILGGF